MNLTTSKPGLAIALNNLTVTYNRHPALHHISGQVQQGALAAVVGPNGAGKSSLLKSLVGLVPVHAPSTIEIAPWARQRMAYLPQQTEIDRGFPMRVSDCVLLGCWSQVGAFGRFNDGQAAQVEQALQLVGLQGFDDRPVGTLSSGQFQRVMFARLMMQDAQLILLDEPFTAVDTKTSAVLMDLVLEWHRQGRTVIAVVHDDALVRQHFPETLLLARECIAWGATEDVLTPVHWARAHSMIEAWDETAALCKVDQAYQGRDFASILAERLAAGITKEATRC